MRRSTKLIISAFLFSPIGVAGVFGEFDSYPRFPDAKMPEEIRRDLYGSDKNVFLKEHCFTEEQCSILSEWWDKFTVDLVDLNNDGEPEIIADLIGCGSGGCTFNIYRKSSDGYTKIFTDGFGQLEVLKLLTKGYRNLEVVNQGGYSSRSIRLYQYDGIEYKEVGCKSKELVKTAKGERWITTKCGDKYLKDNDNHTTLNKYSDFKINRFFQSTENFFDIVISTSKSMRVKCVLYDYNGEPLAAHIYHITPPVEQVPIEAKGVAGLVEKVKCFRVE